jgi:hypothetical protein
MAKGFVNLWQVNRTKLLRNLISFYHQRVPRGGMVLSPRHPGSSSVLVHQGETASFGLDWQG